jgi:hypothetical protein
MVTSQCEEWAGLYIIALVELDWQKMRVRIVLEPDAITERLRELEHPSRSIGGTSERPAPPIA